MSISQGRRQDFGSGGTSEKISYMNSSQILYCNGVAKISVLGGHSAILIKEFWKFLKIYKNYVQKFKKFFKKIKFKELKKI